MTSDSIRGALRDASLRSALAGSPPELLPWDVRLFDINLLTAGADQQYIDVESTGWQIAHFIISYLEVVISVDFGDVQSIIKCLLRQHDVISYSKL